MKPYFTILLFFSITTIGLAQTITAQTGGTAPVPEQVYWYEYTVPVGWSTNHCGYNWITTGESVITTSDGTSVGSPFNQRVYIKWVNSILNDHPDGRTVTVAVAGCDSLTLNGIKNLTVNTKYLPAPTFKTAGGSTITTLNVPCYTPEITLRLEPIADAEYYRWELPTGWSKKGSPGVNLFSTTTPTVDVTVPEGNSNASIKAYTSIAGFNGPSTTIPVTRNPDPLVFAGTNPSVFCNSSKPVTYTVTSTIPNATYSWTYPTGWTCSSGCTTNSAILIPNGQNVTNQQIKVSATSTCAGQTKTTPQAIQIINFSTATPPEFVIQGSVVCTGTSNISVPFVASGIGVTWSVTPTNLLVSNTGTGSTAALNAASSSSVGSAQITFTIQNACGNPIVLPKNIWVGKPDKPGLVEYNCPGAYDAPCALNGFPNNGYFFFSLSSQISLTDWQWEKISGNFYFYDNGQYNSNTHTGSTANIYITGANPTDNPMQFRSRVRNTCDWSDWRTFIWNDGTTTPPPPPPPADYFVVYPNPAQYYCSITLADANTIPMSTPTVAELYSVDGILQATSYFSNYTSSFYAGNLTSGSTYYIIIRFSNGNTEAHTLYKL